jgi:4-hydroxy-4-methyl-2-oxoglutarate aldolase
LPVRVNPAPSPLPPGLVQALGEVELPTLGHVLEVGFVDPGLTRVAGTGRLVGRAVTVRVVAPDSALVHRATELLEPGDVLVIDTGGDRAHAPVGAVVGTAVAARGAAGIVIDGPCTDLAALEALGLAIFARGTSALTTKLHALDAGGINVPVVIGRAAVLPGYVVVGDRDGLLLADPADVEAALPAARRSDAAEPDKLRRLGEGVPLTELSAAGDRLRSLLEPPPGDND